MTLTAPSTNTPQPDRNDWPKVILGTRITSRALHHEDGRIQELIEPPALIAAMRSVTHWQNVLSNRPEAVHPELTLILHNLRQAEAVLFSTRRTWLATVGMTWENGEIVPLGRPSRRRK